MTAKSVIHPSNDVLQAFALGKLNDNTAAVVTNHLESCAECCKQVAAQSGDDFLEKLRQEQGRSFTVAPAKSLGDAPRAPKPSARPAAIRNLPPELANNPQYEIVRELGRGGMGVVYLAKNKLMDRLEVLKVVNKTLIDHPAAVERFLREIRSAAKLSHANVVTAYSAVQQGELLAFAMEYVEGQDLATLVKSQGPLPVPHACFYLQQAASGLQHAFEKQMIHRDIKPQNLILAREGKKHIVKVLDFGLAKVMREKTEDTGLTGEGKMLGTPDYIAPEQSLDAAKANIRADIYSLGCTLYYLLSGRPPFSGGGLGAILMAHQMQEAKPLNLVHPEVPEELAAVVRKMMAKTPAKRYQQPLDVVQALAPFVKQGTTPKSPPESSAGPMEAKPGVKKAVSAVPPPVPTAVAAKTPPPPPPVGAKEGNVAVWESLTKKTVASAGPPKREAVGKRRPASRMRTHKKWLMGGGIGTGVLLMALLGMWTGGVFKEKTNDGIQVNELSHSEPDDTALLDPNPRLFIHFHDYKGDKNMPEPTMRFGLLAKDADNPDRSKKLTFDEHGRSNNTVVRLDGKYHIFGDPPDEWLEMKGKLQSDTAGQPRDGLASSWVLPQEQLKVTQEVEIVPGVQSRLLDTCLVRYILENRDTRPHRVGIRFMLDTFIGDNDGVPFAIPGTSDLCDTKVRFNTSDRVPDFIQALEKNDPHDPGTVAYLQFHIGTSMESPSRVMLGAWPNPELQKMGVKNAKAQLTGWDVPFISMKERIEIVDKETKEKKTYSVDDSTVTMYWNEKPLDPGQTRVVGFTYGLGSVSSRESGGHLLLTVGGRLVPNVDFSLMALVHNPKADESLTLELPAGIQAEGQEMTQRVPEVPADASRADSPVTWRLRASQDGKYELSVRSSTGAKQKLPLLIRTRGVFD